MLGKPVTASYRQVLKTPDFVRMLGGHGFATVGQLQLTMAVGIYVLDKTDSGIWVSAAVALGFLPYVLFSAPAGVLADRHSRSSVLRWSIGIRVLTGGLTAAAIVLGWSVPVTVLLAALTATAATPSYPSLAAATPQLVNDRDLPAANSLATGIENAAWTAGPGLLGLILILGAPVAGGGLAATAFLVLAYLGLGRTHTPKPRSAARSQQADGGIRKGLQVIASDSRIRAAVLLGVLVNMLYGYLVVAIVLMGTRAFDAGEIGIGWLNAALAAGAFTSMVVAPRLGVNGREPRVLIIAMTLFVAAAAATAISPTLGLGIIFIFWAGLLMLIVEIVAVTLIQRVAPEAVMARVLGIYDMLVVGAIALASGVAGVLSEVVGVRQALLMASLAMAVLTVSCIPSLRAAHGVIGAKGLRLASQADDG